MGSSLFGIDLPTGHEPGIPVGETPPSTAGGTPAATKARFMESSVLVEVASGKTDKEVAVALNLSPKTARNYVTRIFTKLKVHTRTEAALLYARHADSVTGGAVGR